MIGEYSVQIRVYNKNKSFAFTTDLGMKDIPRTRAKWFVDLYLQPLHEELVDTFLPTNLCNIMVRKNGKLISYKDL